MILDPILDLFRGGALTIPPMDGAFRPNTRLDTAPLLAALTEADNLASADGKLLASSGNAIVSVEPGAVPAVVETFAAPVTALAISAAGERVVGLESGKLLIGDREEILPATVSCITALAFGSDGTLWLTNGSADHPPSVWAADLMRKGASGSLWKREAGGGAFGQVAGGIAFPSGILVDGDRAVVSESWRHRLLSFDGAGRRTTIVDHLPGYPARLSPASGGGAWLSMFAPRNRLVEFVLQEDDYRRDMLAEVPREQWIAPALSSRRSFLEPLQCGAIKTMGVHKPWSPSRSYGMVVRLDAGLQPVTSLHSRADGTRHGICSAIEHDGRLVVAAKGGDCLVAVDLPAAERR